MPSHNEPAPRCSLCNKYASHGPRCGHVDCPCRKAVTVRATGQMFALNNSVTVRVPSTRTDREYD